MNLKNEIVFHKKFGCGAVCEQSGERIAVDFEQTCGRKEFAYPECFSAELLLCDPLAQLELSHELERGSKKPVPADDGFDW